MPSREIPQDEWMQFLDEFSRQHAGRFVTIQMAGADFNLYSLGRESAVQKYHN